MLTSVENKIIALILLSFFLIFIGVLLLTTVFNNVTSIGEDDIRPDIAAENTLQEQSVYSPPDMQMRNDQLEALSDKANPYQLTVEERRQQFSNLSNN